MNIDESFKDLETIVSRMEKQSQTIEESLEDYNKGMTIIKNLRAELNRVEKEIEVINSQTGEVEDQL